MENPFRVSRNQGEIRDEREEQYNETKYKKNIESDFIRKNWAYEPEP